MNIHLEHLEATCLKLIRANKWHRALYIASEVVKLRSRSGTQFSFQKLIIDEVYSLSVRLIELHEFKSVLEMVQMVKQLLNVPIEETKLICKVAAALQEAGKPQLSKKCMLKAIKLEPKKGTLYANMCAILSNMNQFQRAKLYGLEACQLIQEELLGLNREEEEFTTKIEELSVAYHNLGTVEKSLGAHSSAQKWHK